MANGQNGFLYVDRLGFTTSASSADIARPPANVANPLRVRRVWRSTSAGAEWWQADFGVPATVRALLLDHVNFATATIEVSDDPTFASGVTSHGAYSIGQDPNLRDPVFWRRKRIILPTAPVPRRYLRIVPSDVQGGAAYFEIGRALFFETGAELQRNPTEWVFTRVRPATVLEYIGHGIDVNIDGIPYVVCDLAGEPAYIHDGILAQLNAVVGLGKGNPFVLWANRGDPTEAYVMTILHDFVSRERFREVQAPLILRELV